MLVAILTSLAAFLISLTQYPLGSPFNSSKDGMLGTHIDQFSSNQRKTLTFIHRGVLLSVLMTSMTPEFNTVLPTLAVEVCIILRNLTSS